MDAVINDKYILMAEKPHIDLSYELSITKEKHKERVDCKISHFGDKITLSGGSSYVGAFLSELSSRGVSYTRDNNP